MTTTREPNKDKQADGKEEKRAPSGKPSSSQEFKRISESDHKGIHPALLRNLREMKYGQISHLAVHRNVAMIHFQSERACAIAESKIREDLTCGDDKSASPHNYVRMIDTPPALLERCMGVSRFPWNPITSDKNDRWQSIPMPFSQARALALKFAENMASLHKILTQHTALAPFKLEEDSAGMMAGEKKGELWQPTGTDQLTLQHVPFISIFQSSSEKGHSENVRLQFSIHGFWEYIENYKKANSTHASILHEACKILPILLMDIEQIPRLIGIQNKSPEICLTPTTVNEEEVHIAVDCFPQALTKTTHMIAAVDVSGSMGDPVPSALNAYLDKNGDEHQKEQLHEMVDVLYNLSPQLGIPVHTFQQRFVLDCKELVTSLNTKAMELETEITQLNKDEIKQIEEKRNLIAKYNKVCYQIQLMRSRQEKLGVPFWEEPSVIAALALNEGKMFDRLYFAKEAVKKAIQKTQGRVQLMTFSNDAKLFSMEESTTATADGLKIESGTYYKNPIEQFLKICQENPDKDYSILFFTDGLPSDFKTVDAMRKQIKTWKEQYKDARPMRIAVLGAELDKLADANDRARAILILNELLTLGKEPGIFLDVSDIRLLPNAVTRLTESPTMQAAGVKVLKTGDIERSVTVIAGQYNHMSISFPRSACPDDTLTLEGFAPISIKPEACVTVCEEQKALFCPHVAGAKDILYNSGIEISDREKIEEKALILKCLRDAYAGDGKKYAAAFLNDVLNGKFVSKPKPPSIIIPQPSSSPSLRSLPTGVLLSPKDTTLTSAPRPAALPNTDRSTSLAVDEPIMMNFPPPPPCALPLYSMSLVGDEPEPEAKQPVIDENGPPKTHGQFKLWLMQQLKKETALSRYKPITVSFFTEKGKKEDKRISSVEKNTHIQLPISTDEKTIKQTSLPISSPDISISSGSLETASPNSTPIPLTAAAPAPTALSNIRSSSSSSAFKITPDNPSPLPLSVSSSGNSDIATSESKNPITGSIPTPLPLSLSSSRSGSSVLRDSALRALQKIKRHLPTPIFTQLSQDGLDTAVSSASQQNGSSYSGSSSSSSLSSSTLFPTAQAPLPELRTPPEFLEELPKDYVLQVRIHH